jgi:hypothetical protein
MTFGIPSSALPISEDGMVKTERVLEELEKRKKQEKESSNEGVQDSVILIPANFDVLLGRGKFSQENLGNLRYRNLIAAYQDRYETARKSEKTAIADEVVQSIKKCSGRFLKEYYADFIEISDAKAREKVSHSFRSLRQNHLRKSAKEPSYGSDESTVYQITTDKNLKSIPQEGKEGGRQNRITTVEGRSEGLLKVSLPRYAEEEGTSKKSRAA